MSGHNKWAQIKHKKAITDSKKSKIFSKLVRFISVETKLSGGKDSPGLRAAIEKAKKEVAEDKSIDPLRTYMKEMGSVKLLTREEE